MSQKKEDICIYVLPGTIKSTNTKEIFIFDIVGLKKELSNILVLDCKVCVTIKIQLLKKQSKALSFAF